MVIMDVSVRNYASNACLMLCYCAIQMRMGFGLRVFFFFFFFFFLFFLGGGVNLVEKRIANSVYMFLF